MFNESRIVHNSGEWNEYIGQIPDADIYFTPEYCKIYEKNGEGQAQMFVYREGNDFVCYPFLLRKVGDLPAVRQLDLREDLYDITTPYGYGGPITNVKETGKRQDLFRRFSKAFAEACGELRIIAEFVRFHPVLQNHRDYTAVEPAFNRNTIHIDLTASESEIQGRYSRDNRNRIRKALKEGLTVKHSPINEIDSLLSLYYKTMDKKQASDYYYFPRSFFHDTIADLNGHIELIEIRLGDQTIASCLFMHYNQFVHYHLMGSDKDYLRLAPINLLVHHAAIWAKSRGYRYLHLGGGSSGNDNLYRFKKSFDETEANDFYTGKMVRNPEAYQYIVERLGIEEQGSYFPVYRV
ncbi:lipid II:glycine glycyltransferase FemX [Paenibacillus thalictri]|uniref:GNAT family N-acetyltransferase n=1 Tax=Paenibacillus thalictri TaxID=2527873 RepID=A0A4Q9DGJ6_9BACL|nr:GNAT family N-acetyltransferase [Paenibacillus thalictri]TBL70836.1 GNAT family N-acetyltransferase [Paenibacillus thalictri]